jgi:hypothetical protein
MAAKLTRLTHKIVMELHLMAESCTICNSRSRRPVRKLLDTPSYETSGVHKLHWQDHERYLPRKLMESLIEAAETKYVDTESGPDTLLPFELPTDTNLIL